MVKSLMEAASKRIRSKAVQSLNEAPEPDWRTVANDLTDDYMLFIDAAMKTLDKHYGKGTGNKVIEPNAALSMTRDAVKVIHRQLEMRHVQI